MRVDFYQLGEKPAAGVAAALARKTWQAGERMLIVSADAAQLAAISDALWANAPEMLAHGMAGGAHDARQPILLAEVLINANDARFVLLADGEWRDPGSGFARAILLFDNSTIDGARGAWRALGKQTGVERHSRRFENRRWVESP